MSALSHGRLNASKADIAFLDQVRLVSRGRKSRGSCFRRCKCFPFFLGAPPTHRVCRPFKPGKVCNISCLKYTSNHCCLLIFSGSRLMLYRTARSWAHAPARLPGSSSYPSLSKQLESHREVNWGHPKTKPLPQGCGSAAAECSVA
jgi:hypothetical protein